MKKQILTASIFILPVLAAGQVYIEKGAEVFVGKNAELIVGEDIQGQENIEGDGTIVLDGKKTQKIDLDNKSLPRLLIENNNGVTLLSGLKINRELILKEGHLLLNEYNLELDADAGVKGNASSYIVTNGNGKVIKPVNSDLGNFMFPVGTTNEFLPLLIKSSGKYSDGVVEIAAKPVANPHKPLSSKDYLQNYWVINNRGIDGDLTATAFYNKVNGSEENLQPYYWDGSKWNTKQAPIDIENKLLRIDVPGGNGEIYAMRKGDEFIAPRNSIALLPNPVKNNATIVINSTKNENAIIKVIDNSGTIVLTQKLSLRKGVNLASLNVTALANGHYIILTNLKNVGSLKMIKGR